MKINKIELKNYRIHKEYTQEFTEGINLLLGSNGSGKSSVLEAIGFALFDSKVRSNIQEIVSEGEKNGSVKVFFTGNDCKDYEVERKIGGKANLDNKTIGKILGIDNINNNFFESVICAKQNQFIDIFIQTPAERAKHFDKLFNTEIYIDLYKKLGEQNEKMYLAEKMKKEARKNAIAEGQKNIKDLENDLEILNKNLAEEIKNKEILENEFKSKKEELEKRKKKKELINAKENNLKNSERTIKFLIDTRNNNKLYFEKSEQAKVFLEKNNENFEKYELAKKESEALEKEFLQFKNAAKIYEDLQKQEQKEKELQIKALGEKEKEETNVKYLNEQIDKLQSEQSNMSKGICPILKIQCANLAGKEKNDEIQELIKKRDFSVNRLKKIEEYLVQKKAKLNELKPQITEAEQNKENAKKLRDKIEEIKNETLNPMENIYQQCRENKKIANEYETLKARLAENESTIKAEEKNKEDLSRELNEIKAKFSEEDLKKQEEIVRNLDAKRIAQAIKTEGLNKDIEQKNREIETCKKTAEEIEKLNSEIALDMQKLTLTKVFRDNIKDLGRIVVEKRVQYIVHNANNYFSQFTSGAESIQWLCTEDEKYSLYLDNGQNKRSFANLSGGEQISVAIAIRLALSQEFGNAGLIILDEPTNNLDQNRRQLLADNLPKMARNLNQLFVVTHDDTFRHCASKVVEL